jgi:hypothetical protein
MSDIKHVNNSGFPLQMAVAHHIREMNQEWNVLYEEHAWQDETDSGFMDLVIEDFNHTWLMNIECKRVRDTSWVFLRDTNSSRSRRAAQLWVTSKRADENPIQFEWVNIPMDPECAQSAFCIVQGQDQKARPMLERVAAELVSSTEALARQEVIAIPNSYSNLRIYQNVIITTADLKVCDVETAKIALATGEIDVHSNIHDVPYVRFRKQLGVDVPGNINQYGGDVKKMTLARESTVFVVNASYLQQFLANCELPENLGPYVRNAS